MYNKRNKSFGWASSITEISPGVGLLFIDHSETELVCVCGGGVRARARVCVRFDSLRPINNLSVKQGQVLMG